MSKINLTRKSEFKNTLRKYTILVDGINMGSIGNGKSIQIDIEPGIHTIQAKIDWCTSNELEIKIEEEGIELQVGAAPGSSFLNTFINTGRYLRLEEVIASEKS